jgi:sigma-B regulation protein RsbU (phosphoserine phosphatase)
MFATLFFGVLDMKTGVMRYINGGHESAYVIGPRGIKNKLEPNGPAVGVLTDAQFEVGQTVLAPGDGLVTYTDGITEARSPQGELFGRARLDALLNQPSSSAGQLIELINSQLYGFVKGESQEDDVTILAISRRSEEDV